MATDKKGVMVYLPADVEQWLEKYCTENNITRKGKDGQMVTSMGNGIVHYLNNQLLGIKNEKGITLSYTDSAGIETITKALVNQAIEGDEEMSRDDVLEMVRESIAPLSDELAELRSEFSGLKTLNPPELVTAESLTDTNRKLSDLNRRIDAHQANYH